MDSVGGWFARNSVAAIFVGRPGARMSWKLASWCRRWWRRFAPSMCTQGLRSGHHMDIWCIQTCSGSVWSPGLWRRLCKVCRSNRGEKVRRRWPICCSPRSHRTATLLCCTASSLKRGRARSSVERLGQGPQWSECRPTSWRPWA